MIGTAAALIGGGAALAGGVANAIGQGQAGAAQAGAARDQVQLAREALQQQIQARNQGISQAQAAAAMSPAEINSISQLLSTREQALSASLSSINKQQTQLDQLDPNVKASGQNLYNLLTGQSAAILAPLQTSLNNQRQSMMDRLSSQMGPGFMTSSAGMMAMTQFDQQASLTLNSAQLNAIQTVGQQYGSLSGLQQQGQGAITSQTGSAFNSANAATSGALQAEQFGQNRMVTATLGAQSANQINPFGVPGAQQNVVDTAGAPYAGLGAIGGSLSGIGQGALNMGFLSSAMSSYNNGNMGGGNSNPSGGNPNPFMGNSVGYSANLGVNTSMPNLPVGTGAFAR